MDIEGKKIGFIGAGNMATAIIKGLTYADHSVEKNINIYDIDTEKLKCFTGDYAIYTDINLLVQNSDYIILAIKPQNFTEVLQALKNHNYTDKVFISIAAGISANFIKSYLGDQTKVVLVMPNTPLLMGLGASALSKIAPTTEKEFQFVLNVFNASGITREIDQEQMIPIIAVNGTAPALIYRFAKAMCQYATKQGIDYDTALDLFAQTLKGSAEMLIHSGYNVDELTKMVSSPGGTTIKALEAFDQLGFDQTIVTAAEKCMERGYELSK